MPPDSSIGLPLHLPPAVQWTIAGIFGVLILASAIVWSLRRARPEVDFSELQARVKTWWVMIVVFSIAMVASRGLSILFFACVSFLALKEYLSMIPTRRADRRVLFWAYAAIPVQYLWIGIAWYGMFIIFIPVYMFLLLPMRMVTIGRTEGFLRAAGTVHWGLMTTVFSISHASYLLVLRLPEAPDRLVGPGLVLTLVLLTQFNDVAQYCWGRLIGGPKVVPAVSPGKTWAGFAGGLLTTVALATGVAPLLTPLSWQHAMLAGLLIGLGGFVGDIVVSAVKRDIGIKDAGNLLPGHGGILDRVDSLTYTAPLFFHFVYYLYF